MSKQSHTLNTAQIFDIGVFSLICFNRVICILTVSYKDKLQTYYEFGYFLNNLVQIDQNLTITIQIFSQKFFETQTKIKVTKNSAINKKFVIQTMVIMNTKEQIIFLKAEKWQYLTGLCKVQDTAWVMC